MSVQYLYCVGGCVVMVLAGAGAGFPPIPAPRV